MQQLYEYWSIYYSRSNKQYVNFLEYSHPTTFRWIFECAVYFKLFLQITRQQKYIIPYYILTLYTFTLLWDGTKRIKPCRRIELYIAIEEFIKVNRRVITLEIESQTGVIMCHVMLEKGWGSLYPWRMCRLSEGSHIGLTPTSQSVSCAAALNRALIPLRQLRQNSSHLSNKNILNESWLKF